ncbi:CASP-like protein 1B1 [Iris pallida]|uniref:CASP-like protein n=1 Tax=Iris pallida TaxID=29817 RepID=A0AAX6H593_IRIPA|nr:CASP-like protein 1B1 [Iris pallida]
MANIEANDMNEMKNDAVWRQMLLPKATKKMVSLLPVLLRVAVVLLTLAAALAMGLNRQSRSITVAIVGTTPIIQAFVAKFQHTPAFVYFVIANATVSTYNLLVLLLSFFLSKRKAYHLTVHIMDLVMMALLATGAAAAASMAELGKNGNYHARWSPICDRFEAYCHRGGLALTASFIGAFLLTTLNAQTILALYYRPASQL